MKEEQFNEFLQDEDKKVDYKTIVFEYLLYWPVILAFLVVTLAGAYVYLRYQAPVYSVSSTVLIKQGDKTKYSCIFILGFHARLGYAFHGQ